MEKSYKAIELEKTLQQCKSLKQLKGLLDVINEHTDTTTKKQIDYSKLPVFSNIPLKDTEFIFSYNGDKILAWDDTCDMWKLELRCSKCQEAEFNCCCKL